MPRIVPFALVAAISLLTVGTALAQEKEPAKAEGPDKRQAGKSRDRTPKGVITLAELTITGRIQKPIASIDVARISPRLTLSDLKQPFLSRIGDAMYRDPF
ncbi:MAG: hypothetical protein AAGA56_01030 [Myxococcota bacterium]